ncbi:MAG: tetratricopeptide repeat protein, partial [Geobacter sp.]|nr:tetratricopeptide repeat protein [Geobacter sp.]
LCLATATATRQLFAQRHLTLFASLVVLLLSLLTIVRNQVWQSEISLWEDVTVKSPKKGRGYGALGHAYQRSGNFDRAEAAYRRAIELSPGDHVARNNLGALYLEQKRYEEALKEFTEGLQLSGTSAVLHFNLGLASAGLGRFPAAEAAFAEALRLKPDYRQAAENLAKIRSVTGQLH